MKFFIDGKNLRSCRVTQNEIGVYYYNPTTKVYQTAVLKNFNTTKPKRGFYKYGPRVGQKLPAGSHWSTNTDGVNVRRQRALDVRAPKLRESVFTSDIDWKLEDIVGYKGKQYGVYTSGKRIFGIPRWKLYLVHTKRHPRIGKVIKAGQKLAVVYYDHFHIYIGRFGLPYPIRKLILA